MEDGEVRTVGRVARRVVLLVVVMVAAGAGCAVDRLAAVSVSECNWHPPESEYVKKFWRNYEKK